MVARTKHSPKTLSAGTNDVLSTGSILVIVPNQPRDHASNALRQLADSLLEQIDQLCSEQCRLIREEVAAYRRGGAVTDDDLFAEGRAHLKFMLETMGSGDPDVAPARQLGTKRAQQGIPLDEVMSAYRVGSRFWWEEISRRVEEGDLPRRSLLLAGSEIWQGQAEYSEEMAVAYRQVVTDQLIQQQHARSALVAGLLEGPLPEGVSAWDAVRILGLPDNGYVAVVAIGGDALDTGMPKVEQALSAVGFPSAWRRESDALVGLVSLSSRSRVGRLQQVLHDNTGHSIGVSPLYEGIPPFGEGLRYARAALLAATGTDRTVMFDQNPYAVAAVSDPETMRRYAATVLGAVNTLDVQDKMLLVDTFRQWIRCGGAFAETAEQLCCHTNTVRYRLRRLKELTGRDVTRPGDVAELWLAVEADTRLNS